MEPAELAKTVADHASVQSDRWLFIALLVIVFFSLAAMAKWFMNQLDRATSATQSAQAAFTEHLKGAGVEQAKVMTECTQAIHRMNEIGEQALAAIGRRKSDPPI
jgi:hypothetical protein